MSTACTSEEIHQLTLSHNIHLFCLPAHTTHRLQPLDVGIFGPLATAMARRCDQVLQDTGAKIPVQDFVKEYMVAHDEAFKAKTIKKAFKNSGIRPFNPNIFTEADYAPSRVLSTQAHTPSTYPQAVFRYQPYTPLSRNDNDPLTRIPVMGTIQMVKAKVTEMAAAMEMATAMESEMEMAMAMVKAMTVKVAWMKTTWIRTIRLS